MKSGQEYFSGQLILCIAITSGSFCASLAAEPLQTLGKLAAQFIRIPQHAVFAVRASGFLPAGRIRYSLIFQLLEQPDQRIQRADIALAIGSGKRFAGRSHAFFEFGHFHIQGAKEAAWHVRGGRPRPAGREFVGRAPSRPAFVLDATIQAFLADAVEHAKFVDMEDTLAVVLRDGLPVRLGPGGRSKGR
jgi:hypothetical protein